MRNGNGKCRILFVIDDMGIGGAQKQVAETVNGLDADRYECDIACISAGGISLDRVRSARQVYILGADRAYDRQAAAAALRLASIVRRGRYGIVEAYLPAPHVLAGLATAGLRRTAFVASLRQLAWLDPPYMGIAWRFLRPLTRVAIANSHAVKDSVIRRYGLPARRIAVVGNVVENRPAVLSKSDARRHLGIGEGEFVVAAAGRFSAVKDYPTILRAFAGLRCRDKAVSLLIAGEGKGLKSAQESARGFGLNGEVRFLGGLKDVSPMLAAADCFVHASRSEGLSNAILEAMAAGLPVVASDIAANREALGPGAGLFFAPGDWQGCLQALGVFADDTQAASRGGSSGRARALRAYGRLAIMRRRERIYAIIRGR